MDNKLDILCLTETWLKPEGDEYTISTMTPTGYVCRSFPRDARGYGGIAFVLRSNIEATFTPLDFTTFECVEMKTKHGNATITCVYRPPYSTNKDTNAYRIALHLYWTRLWSHNFTEYNYSFTLIICISIIMIQLCVHDL